MTLSDGKPFLSMKRLALLVKSVDKKKVKKILDFVTIAF